MATKPGSAGTTWGDEYLGLDPDLSPWRDTHVRLEGPAALQAQLTVLADWYWATRELPDVQLDTPSRQRMPRTSR